MIKTSSSDEEESEDEDAEMPEGSLFDYKVPGVLTKGEVAKLDLGHWKLVVRQSLIDLEVRVADVFSMFPTNSDDRI